MVIVVLIVLLKPSVPDDLRARGLLFNEKIMHAILFGTYYLVAVIAWKNPLRQLLVVFFFSLLTETLQTFTGRSFEWADLLANMVGAFLVFIVYQAIYLLRKKYT